MNIFKKIARKKLSGKDQVRLMFRDQFDNCIKNKEIKKSLCGDPTLDGLLVYTAISITYKTLKESQQLQTMSAWTLLNDGYNPLVILEEELNRALKIYCNIDNDKDELSGGLEDYGHKEPETPDMLADISREDIENTINELGLAPDLSKNNDLENKLFAIAKQGTSMIQNQFRIFPNGGYAEALIYCSSFLVNLGTEHENEIDLDIFEDRYFLLLHDEVMCNSNVDNTINYINSRVGFYNEQERKLKASSTYTPMFIYNAFYMNPGCDSPDILFSFSESPLMLIQLNAVLIGVKKWMESKANALGYEIPSKSTDDDIYNL